MSIKIAETDVEIAACFAVMRQLRTHLEAEEFVPRVRTQQSEGYRLVSLSEGDQVVAVAGYRIGNNLAWGKFLYVDDLVTDGARRSGGHGRKLMDWLIAAARSAGCDQFHLDSGVQRYPAHRFYLRHGMDITSQHFVIDLNAT